MSQERAVAIYAYRPSPTIVHFDEDWHAARKRNEPMSLPVDWDVVAVVQGELAPDGLIINGGGGATYSATEVLETHCRRHDVRTHKRVLHHSGMDIPVVSSPSAIAGEHGLIGGVE